MSSSDDSYDTSQGRYVLSQFSKLRQQYCERNQQSSKYLGIVCILLNNYALVKIVAITSDEYKFVHFMLSAAFILGFPDTFAQYLPDSICIAP